MSDKILNIKPGMRQDEVAKAYSDYLGLPIVKLLDKKIAHDVLGLIPKNVALTYHIIAYELTKDKPPVLKIAVADPDKLKQEAPSFLVDLKKEKKLNIELNITTLDDFNLALKFYDEEKIIEKPKIEDKPTVTNPASAFEVELIGKHIPYEVLNKFPEEIANKYQMVVFEAPEGSNKIKVAMVDTKSEQVEEILDFIEKRNQLTIEKYQTSKKSIDYALALYQQQPAADRPIDKLEKKVEASEKQPSGIPLAQPIAELTNLVESSLPPLEKYEKKTEEPTSKPNQDSNKQEDDKKDVKSEKIQTATITSEELKSVEIEEVKPVFFGEDHEKNISQMLPSGVHNTETLSKIIKSGIIQKIVAGMICLAVEEEASDIHLEPTSKDFRLRYRVDGILQDIMRMPLELNLPIVSRIKILSKLKIDEQRVPQDGRFDVVVTNKEIDLRVSTLPTIHGEKVVMRILDKSGGVKNIEDLGFRGTNLDRLTENMKKPYGIILATGPTGSGKSTTLYAILNKISSPEVNIITLEDPVEYEMPGVNQCQIRPKIGFGFAEGLRSILRQDPNIIMVGEIRDTETASMATHAALTGHLVLSTLHTNDAAGALPRLINMGIEPFLITSAINCIVAQRLLRKICPHCKEEAKIPAPLLEEISKELTSSKSLEVNKYSHKELKFFKGKGCSYCSHGYKGRIGIYEVLPITAKIEEIAVHKRPASEILNQALEEKMVSMKQDGIMKALDGLTSIDEVLRVTSD